VKITSQSSKQEDLNDTISFRFRTFAPKSSHAQIFLNSPRRKVMIYNCQKGKKKMGVTTLFWREHAPKNTLNLKNLASLADRATVSVSPKILQLDL